MAQSITLQTSDNDIIASDILGRIAFAASSETSGSDAILIGGGIYAEAESAFTAVSNATSLVFATASSESATGKLKITSGGHLLPLLNNTYDIGSSSFTFRNLYLNSGIFTNNVGIGTGSPSARLHVVSAASQTAALISGPAGGSLYVDFAGAGTNYYDGNHTWRTASGARTTATLDNRFIMRGNNEPYALGVMHSSSGGAVYFGANSSSASPDAQISNAGGASLMVLQNGGNVGIGTASPAQKLDITGGSLSINTNGQSSIFSTRYGANSAGFNVWIGNGGASAIGNNLATNWGSYNSSCGISALLNNTTGYQNCAFGNNSLLNNTSGYYNSAFGQACLQNNIVGVSNCAFGLNALFTNTGNNNSAFGFCSMQFSTAGYFNAAFGSTSLYENTTGHSNCAFGTDAGRFINSGSGNQTSNTSIYLGRDSRASANGNTNEIVIGNASRGNGSNTVTIGNSSITNNFFNGTIIANSIAGNASNNNVVDGRLTISQGSPVPVEIGNTFSNVLYFTPFNGNRISLYDTANSRWQIHTFSEISISLATGYAANTMYDVFIFDNAGTKTLELTAWTTQGGYASPTATASARSTGSVLALQDGVYVKSGSPNKRYIGTARTNATAGVVSDGPDQRFLWNMYNRVTKDMEVTDGTTHTYATAAFRLYRNQSANIVEFIVGLDRYTNINMSIITSSQVSPASSIPVGIGIDITNGTNSIAITNNVDSATLRTGSSDFITNLSAGYHYLAMVQYGATGAGFNNATIGATVEC